MMGDVARLKKTVPLVFFYKTLVESTPALGLELLRQQIDDDFDGTWRKFENSGARPFCEIIAEVFLNRAKANVEELRDLVIGVSGLEDILDSFIGKSPKLAVAT